MAGRRPRPTVADMAIAHRTDPVRVAVISGGPGPEHAVSLGSGRAIATALESSGSIVTRCTVSEGGAWVTDGRAGLPAAVGALRRADVAIPALHGPWGEDGGVQGFLETLGVPYVGSGVLASATCMDKGRTKRVLADAGLAVAPGRTVLAPLDAAAGRDLVRDLGLPLFVKPVAAGSSYGVTRVTDAADLPAAVEAAARFGGSVLVERALRGREIDVAVLELPDGRRAAGPPLEIRPDPAEPFFTTTAKYAGGATRFLVPAPVDAALATTLEDTALRAFDALGCAGLARIDGFVDPDLGLVINEVNTFPGFTERSQFPRIWAAAGLTFPALVRTLVDTALAARRSARAA